MATDDVRISAWDLRASAGTTVALEFTSTEALTSLSVYTGGTTSDVDDLTDATEHAATLSGANLVATVDVDVPTAGSPPMRLVVDGAVQSIGRLIPSTKGTASPDNTITLSPGSYSFALTVLGIVVNEGGGGGGGTDDQTAAEVPFTPAETIAATNVQAAIEEVSTDLAAKAPLASPTFTGTPAAPTPTAGDNTTKVATTAFVKTATDALSGTYAPLTPSVGTALGTTGTVNLDMAALNGTYQSIAATGDITFTTSNRAAGRTVTIKIAAGASGRTITLPSWILVGAAVALASGKTGILTVTFFDTTDAAAVAAWAVQA